MPIFSTKGSNKTSLKIECQLISLKCTNVDYLNNNIVVEFVRGPQKLKSKVYSFYQHSDGS